MISEFKGLYSTDLTTLFEKFQEHKIKLKCLVENKDGDKNEERSTFVPTFFQCVKKGQYPNFLQNQKRGENS